MEMLIRLVGYFASVTNAPNQYSTIDFGSNTYQVQYNTFAQLVVRDIELQRFHHHNVSNTDIVLFIHRSSLFM